MCACVRVCTVAAVFDGGNVGGGVTAVDGCFVGDGVGSFVGAGDGAGVGSFVGAGDGAAAVGEPTQTPPLQTCGDGFVVAMVIVMVMVIVRVSYRGVTRILQKG
jgi:hypothetical protein